MAILFWVIPPGIHRPLSALQHQAPPRPPSRPRNSQSQSPRSRAASPVENGREKPPPPTESRRDRTGHGMCVPMRIGANESKSTSCVWTNAGARFRIIAQHLELARSVSTPAASTSFDLGDFSDSGKGWLEQNGSTRFFTAESQVLLRFTRTLGPSDDKNFSAGFARPTSHPATARAKSGGATRSRARRAGSIRRCRDADLRP